MNDYIGDIDMQQIGSIVDELKTIMNDSSISQTHIVNALDNKCSKNTILTFFKGDSDCKLSTLLMILDACGANLRIDTERSKESILAGDIASYRTDAENLRSELEHTEAEKKYFQDRFDELVNKNTSLAETIDKQQETIDKQQETIDKQQAAIGKQQAIIDKYMLRMEEAEKALYAVNADCRRKDARIVELSKECNKW